jgi:adenine-specific DNA-methyltransferase
MTTRKTSPGPIPVEATQHGDTRVNIPTGELADFVADDEKQPTTVLYPRDPTLDPQLVWRGKDEQDLAEYLRVASVPIYIQEKIDPRAIVENLRSTATANGPEPELTLFDDFDGLEFDQVVDFYAHEGNWSNRLILGDSLLVMNSLAEKESLSGKVQMIFIDPPYGINFGSNWQVSTRKREVSDGKHVDVTRQPEQIEAFRDTWELGIHSYLSYLRDRLTAARELLTDSGSVFVQIGDANIHRVRALLDEIFGDSNFVSLVTFTKTAGTTGRYLPGTVDYLLWYAKELDNLKYRPVYLRKTPGGAGTGQYTWIEEPTGERRRRDSDDPDDLPLLRMDNLTSPRVRAGRTGYYPVELDGKTFLPGKGEWKTNQEGMNRLKAAGRLHPVGNTLSYVRYLDDFGVFPISNQWTDTVTSGFGDPKVFVVQTNSKVVERCVLMSTDPGDLVLDPTCGSGTTAYAAEHWGRRWITIDTSRVALALARTRLMSARFPYYLLADSPEGARRDAELTGQLATSNGFGHDVRKGFVYKRVPHITL